MIGPFLMVVLIVLISIGGSALMYWLKLYYSGPMDEDMEEDFFRMRDEIDRLNERVNKLETR